MKYNYNHLNNNNNIESKQGPLKEGRMMMTTTWLVLQQAAKLECILEILDETFWWIFYFGKQEIYIYMAYIRLVYIYNDY